MDLFDFPDVAMDYDFFDEVLTKNDKSFSKQACEDFHISITDRFNCKKVLDIACGTGCPMISLCRQGLDVTGVDNSQAMLNVLNQKLCEQKYIAHLVCSNMSNFDLQTQFDLTIIARSGFLHLTTTEDQIKALNAINHHLVDEGILTFSTNYPNFELLAKALHGIKNQLEAEFQNSTGNFVKIFSESIIDPETQTINSKWTFKEFNAENELVKVRERPLKLRFTFPSEIEHLLVICGFKVLERYGGYDYCPPMYPGNIVWLAQKVGNSKIF